MSSLERAARLLSEEIDQLAAKLSAQERGNMSQTPALLERADSVAQLAKASSSELSAILTDLRALQANLVMADNNEPESD